MGTVVVDAGVVIGWLDGSDPHHGAAVAALDEYLPQDVRLPASALAEVLVRHVGRGSVELAREAIRSAGLIVDPIDEDGALEAATIRAQRRLRLPDALVLGHALAISADVVLTTDRSWRRVSRRVRLVA